MDDEVHVTTQRDRDALAEPVDTRDLVPRDGRPRGRDGAEKERITEPQLVDRAPDDPPPQTLDVHRDVGQLGHGLGM